MKIIVLSGKMCSGKSTIADYLIENNGYHRISLAAPLKQEILDIGFPPDAVASKTDWMRKLLIAYGQARRAMNPTYWIDMAQAEMIRQTDAGIDLFVVDDCRFVNEVEAFKMLRNLGHEVTFARVERHAIKRIPLAVNDPFASDTSESELDDFGGWDAVIRAEGGDINGLIDNALTQLKLKRPGATQLDLFHTPCGDRVEDCECEDAEVIPMPEDGSVETNPGRNDEGDIDA